LSILSVVWFQDAFAMPIAEEALEKMRKIPWNRLATSWTD
jgi:hypothetical protein